MALEQTLVKLTDRVAKDVVDGMISYAREPKVAKYIQETEVAGQRLVIYVKPIFRGKLVKVSESEPQLSKDRSTLTYTGQKFDRTSEATLVFEALFGNEEPAFYELGEVSVSKNMPKPSKNDEQADADSQTYEKLAEKLEKKLTTQFKKIGIIA